MASAHEYHMRTERLSGIPLTVTAPILTSVVISAPIESRRKKLLPYFY